MTAMSRMVESNRTMKPLTAEVNSGSWQSCGCYLTRTTHSNTVADQAHPLVAPALPDTWQPWPPSRTMRSANSPRNLTKSSTRWLDPNCPAPNTVVRQWDDLPPMSLLLPETTGDAMMGQSQLWATIWHPWFGLVLGCLTNVRSDCDLGSLEDRSTRQALCPVLRAIPE